MHKSVDSYPRTGPPGPRRDRTPRARQPGWLLLSGALALAPPALAEVPPSYRVSVDPGLATLSVRACFPDRLPGSLEPADPDAAPALRAAVLARGGRTRDLALAPRLRIPLGQGPLCVGYRVDLAGSLSDSWRGLGMRVPGAVLLSTRFFLWVPPWALTDGMAGATLTFDLPDGMRVAVPWESVARGRSIVPAPSGPAATASPTLFAFGKRPLIWDARVAIGRFDRFDLELPGGRLETTVLAGDPPVSRGRIEPWLRANADALSRALDPADPRLPLGRLQVLVVPTGTGGEPVPWGEVMRGGGDAVHLYIDQTRPQAEFLADWVAIHEMSHLLHPHLEGDGRWLAEGIASLYQNLLPVRAGWRTEQDAWAALYAGFGRGQQGTKPGQTLAEASRDMVKARAFMRVYWSGAAIALLGDLELRQASGGTQSLDWALAELRRRQGPFDRGWSARELMDRLDAVTGRRVFGKLMRRWLDSDRFPDLGPAYRVLGLKPDGAAGLQLSQEAQAVGMRRGLMQGGG